MRIATASLLLCLVAPLLAYAGYRAGLAGRGAHDAAPIPAVALDAMEHFTTTGGRYDGAARWTFDQGVLIGREGPQHAGGLIYTRARFADAEIELDCKIDHPFDSGIFFRMGKEGKGPQVTLDDRPGGEIGGIYADGWWCHTPDGARAWKKNGWNHVRARCVGEPAHITVWINDTLVCDHRLPGAAAGFASEGMIGLQVHGGASTPPEQSVRFRNIRVRDLGRSGATALFEPVGDGRLALRPQARALGWRDLLAGGDLAAWTAAGDGTGFRVTKHVLELLHAGGAPHLMSREDYEDFHLVLEFKIADMANSGIFLRAARDGSNPAFSGREVQVLDDHNWERVTQSTLKPWQFTGSLYGAMAPARRVLRPNGAWNQLEVICRGTRQLTALNGHVLYDVDTHALEVKPPFQERAKTGFLGIQRHAPGGTPKGNAYAWYRNIFIRSLPAPQARAEPADDAGRFRPR